MAEIKCFKLETWAMVYGILIYILASIGILVGFEFMIYLNYILIRGGERVLYIFIVLGGISPGFFLIPFSVVLICGVCMKKPGLVLTFLIFGITLSILAMSVAVLFMIIDRPCIEYIAALILFLICSLPLIVVYKTYKKLQRDRICIRTVQVKADDNYDGLGGITTPSNENKYRKVETWALIYGILTIILSGVGIFVGVGIMAYFNLTYIDKTILSSVLLAAISPAPGLLILPFSIVLVYGVCQKKPALVLTYFIFGIVSILVTVAAFYYFYNDHPKIGVTSLYGYLIYSLPLIVVFRTFRKFESSAVYNYSNKF